MITVACAFLCDGIRVDAQPFPSQGPPNPAMIGVAPAASASPAPPSPQGAPRATPPTADAVPSASSAARIASNVPRAVTVARTTIIPACTIFVDAAAPARGSGSVQEPFKTITAAVAASGSGAVICVAEGVYAEQLKPGEKSFTLAGGFQRGSGFRVRDSARYVSKAVGRSGSFIRYEDPGPKGNQLTAIDGFDISGYAQAIFRDIYYSQRFDIINNHIHDNRCDDLKLAGAGAALNNVSGRIAGNVFRNNSCGRGGAVFVYDGENKNSVLLERNFVDGNAGAEPDSAHGGAFYIFGKTLTVRGNLFTNNSVTQWGGGLYVGAYTEGGIFTTATLSWNVYRANRAGNGGGGFFCDDGATCISDHEIFDRNCGSNVYVDGGSDTSEPTVARFDHMTNVGALDPDCQTPGPGVRIDKNAKPKDTYTFTNSIFWNNGPGKDFVGACDSHCDALKVTVSHSMAQTQYVNWNTTIVFGDGIMTPSDPLFAAPEAGDFHLKSTAGRWTPTGYVTDSEMSPAVGKGDPRSPVKQNPERAGTRSELGAFGNSAEASYVR